MMVRFPGKVIELIKKYVLGIRIRRKLTLVGRLVPLCKENHLENKTPFFLLFQSLFQVTDQGQNGTHHNIAVNHQSVWIHHVVCVSGVAVCVLGLMVCRMEKGRVHSGPNNNYAFKPLKKKKDTLFSDDSDEDIGLDQ